MRTFLYALMVVAAIASRAPALSDALTLSGVVTDSRSHSPIPRATVSVTGELAVQDEVTDVDGIFVLTFIATVKPGDTIRLRVQDAGCGWEVAQASPTSQDLGAWLRQSSADSACSRIVAVSGDDGATMRTGCELRDV